MRQAVRYNFEDRIARTSRELRELPREDRRELLVGVPILALSIAASQLIINMTGPATLARVFSESLLIFGWRKFAVAGQSRVTDTPNFSTMARSRSPSPTTMATKLP
jgi:hypothetical protein